MISVCCATDVVRENGRYLLGVDLGLTVIKAAVFDLGGRAVGGAAVKTVQRKPRPRWVEEDLDEQWHDCARVVRTAVQRAGVDPASLAAVGVAGHGDGAYLIDDRGRPTRPGIASLDARSIDVVAEWKSTGVARRALELTGQEPSSLQPPPILAWLKANEPHALDAARWILFPKDWIKLRLTGEVTTDPTEASTGFTDVTTQDYSLEVLRNFGLEELAGRLPPIVGSTEQIGSVTPHAAEATSIPAGTPVVSGLHDVDASALGSGCARPGLLMVITGTYSINELISDEPAADSRWLCRNWIRGGRWMNMGASPSSAANLEWYVRGLCPAEVARAEAAGVSPFDFVSEEVARVLDEPSGLVFHPFVYGSPHGDVASGAFLGLRATHERAHVLRALLEGVCFNHLTHVSALRSRFAIDEARAAGGGTRSTVWTQMLCDVIGVPLSITAAEQEGALGAAICAGVGVGEYGSVEEGVEQTVSILRRHEPDPRRAGRLAEAYELYRATIEAIQPLWPRLG